ncbi:MAG: metallophosphoesterase [Bacteroidota bacterium]
MKKCKKILFAIAVLVAIQSLLYSQVPTPKGLWKFDNSSNLIKAEIGNDLELVGTHSTTTGPTNDNGAVKIGIGSYYKLSHAILPNGGGSKINEYTVMIDFRIPKSNSWYSIFQTNITNSNDAECFINPNGYIGVQSTGYSTFSIKPDEWYRLVISVKNGTHLKYYIDGHLVLNGLYQVIDGRFALENTLLLFADDNGEDGEIDCAEAAIWDYSLSYDEVKSLGDYGHAPRQLILVPYLQTPTSNSIYISWHDSSSVITKVEYGTTPSLGLSENGTSEVIYSPYVWHTVKLTGLQPGTEYFYKVISKSGSSSVYSFKTLPPSDYKGKIRILLLSDTHADDTTMAVKVIKEAKKKLRQLYGNDIQNHVNLILHSGDLVMAGYDVTQWTDQYFAPLSPISPYIPTMTVAGNHEGEDYNYYSYMKYDDVSPYPAPDPLNEKFWSINILNTAIVGLNSNLTNSRRAHQTSWLENKLQELELDPKIDFVVIIVHHLPISELWGEGMTDGGSVYVRTQVIPIFKKYSKVVQLSYGHTHGFERGTIESEDLDSNFDFRIVCGGGGGGPIDRWSAFKNFDYPFIHIALDHYFYQLIEIDVSEKIFQSYMYSLGNLSTSKDSELMDSWYRKINQAAPGDPTAIVPKFYAGNIIFNTSTISNDSLMTVRFQLTDDKNFNSTIIDTMIHWKNVYGVDLDFNPIDLNEGIDLTSISFSRSLFVNEKEYYYKVKYRDHNLRWSNWSNTVVFTVPLDSTNTPDITSYDLKQNYPNPFNAITKIIYQIPESGFISLKVFDLLGNEIAILVNAEKKAGRYEAIFDSKNLSSGIYFYQLQTKDYIQTKKLLLIK